jgi:putative sterol carrier protein
MGTSTRLFFDRIAEQEFDAHLGSARGTLQIDIGQGKSAEHWFVTLDRGAISVAHAGVADCVIATDAATFDKIAEGRLNPTAAALRGLIRIDGDIDVLYYFQRLFPAPPRAGRVAAAAGGAR